MVKLKLENLKEIRKMDSKMMSYNVEMTEVTGGTFWKPYTPEQIAGTEEFPQLSSPAEMGKLQKYYEPIDLSNPRLRKLAKELGQVWMRVSGTWATKTYYDFDGHTGGVIPEGYQNLLTKELWDGVLDFAKELNLKILISVSNCPGLHAKTGKWEPDQARLLLDYSKAYGVPVSAVEFMNEPNMMRTSGAPAGYNAEDFARDQDAFYRFIRENYPEILIVGPCVSGDMEIRDNPSPILKEMIEYTAEELLEPCEEVGDIFSYHEYNGTSECLAITGNHWDFEKTLSEEYLAVLPNACEFYGKIRDQYYPNAPMWVTESGDAGGGGNTWGSTFTDVFRSANEAGRFPQMTDGIIFHNTLASSDYGWLEHETFEPRPNYWFILLWNRLMGETVYDSEEALEVGKHVFVHSRKDGKEGVVYMIINNSHTDVTKVELPKDAVRYTLSASELRSTQMMLNGRVLELGENDELPELTGEEQSSGCVALEPETITFFVL